MTQSTTSSTTAADPAGALLAAVNSLSPDLRAIATTHPAWAATRAESYERFEFLGDAVLGAAVADILVARFPASDEGRLARMKARVISRDTCAAVALQGGLDRILAERAAQLRARAVDDVLSRRNVLAAVCESILGAVHLERGFEAARSLVEAAFGDHLDAAAEAPNDHKSALQEMVQGFGQSVSYVPAGVSGPAHEPVFTELVLVDGRELGKGRGLSRRAAQQQAAHEAIRAAGTSDADPAD